jgi:cysteine-rich repeat protein
MRHALLLLLFAGACPGPDSTPDSDSDVETDSDSDSDTSVSGESCTNAADDDGDGRVDCDDADCAESTDCVGGTAPLGGACTEAAECEGEAPVCLDEVGFGWPGGTCARWCSLVAQDCGEGAACLELPIQSGDRGVCMPDCTADSCRTGYECTSYEPYRLCYPSCTLDADCPALGACSDTHGVANSGLCVAPEQCDVPGDEDEDGAWECEDADCAARSECDPSAVCADPPELPIGTPVVGSNEGATSILGASCTGRYLGREAPYTVVAGDVGQTGLLSVTLSGDPDFGLYLRSDCEDPASELECRDNGYTGEGEFLDVGIRGGVPYTLVVDGSFAEAVGAFTVTATFTPDVCGDEQVTGLETCDDGPEPPADGDGCSSLCAIELDTLCDDAPAAATGDNVGDTLAAEYAAFQGSCTLPENVAREQLWRWTPPGTGRARAILYNVAENADLAVYVRTDCLDAASEIACADDQRVGGDEVATFDVVQGVPVTLIVDGMLSDFDGGAYTLLVVFPAP